MVRSRNQLNKTSQRHFGSIPILRTNFGWFLIGDKMKRIQLTQGQFAIVDNKNYKWLSQWNWQTSWNRDTRSFYVTRGTRGGEKERGNQCTIYMAREVLGLKSGDKRQADHINHNTFDNRESNLRIVTCQQNHFNRKKPKGYYWNKTVGKYHAQICVNGRTIYLGLFLTIKEARNAYLKAKKLYHKI